MRKGMARSSSVMMDAAAEATLSTMGLSRKNRAQDEMDDLFQGTPGKAPARTPAKGAAPGGPRRTRARRW
jgi:hypothetical protein